MIETGVQFPKLACFPERVKRGKFAYLCHYVGPYEVAPLREGWEQFWLEGQPAQVELRLALGDHTPELANLIVVTLPGINIEKW